jgi:drug/metabolite transporter (DMT)-like permease
VQPSLFALTTAICFGVNPILVKWGFTASGSKAATELAVFLGLAVAIPIYVALVPFFGGLHWDRVTPAAFVGFVLGGLFGAGIGRGWLYGAIQQIGASRATAIKNSSPLFSTLLAVLVLGESVSPLHWAAVLTIIAGLVLVAWRHEPGKVLRGGGVLMALGAAASYGIRPLFLKFGLDAADLPLTATLVGAIAAIAPYGYTLVRRGGLSLGVCETPMRSIWLFISAGVLQAFGFLALTVALSEARVSVVYPITASAPIVTLVCSYFLLRSGEHLTGRVGIGIVSVVFGVAVLTSR